ncbi:MAG: ascorbate system or component [Chloroflexota bacterium]|nr:ascorbate system or component [Chloroflexota bacterium]
MYIEKYLNEETIQLGCRARDWRDAIAIAAGPLVAEKFIEPAYVTSMQEAVDVHGAYMVLAEGFALAHAQPCADVHQVCMSLITIDPPVNFGCEAFDPVDILIAFGTPDNKSHIRILRELCTLLNDPENFRTIRAAQSVQEIITLFSTQTTKVP